jgi:hypothetical protein
MVLLARHSNGLTRKVAARVMENARFFQSLLGKQLKIPAGSADYPLAPHPDAPHLFLTWPCVSFVRHLGLKFLSERAIGIGGTSNPPH